MTGFTVELADIHIGICALYEETVEAYREYLTEILPALLQQFYRPEDAQRTA